MVRVIVSKVAASKAKCSAPNDLAKLRDDLNRALITFWIRTSLKDKTAVRWQAERAEKVRRAAGALVDLLSSDEFVISTYIISDWPSPYRRYSGLDLKNIGKHLFADPPPSFDAVVEALRRIESNAAEARAISNKWTRDGLSSDRSPSEWLASIALPKLYELHFGEKPRISRPTGTPNTGGPHFLFVRAVFEAANIAYQDESIVRAFGRRNRTRRKAG